MAVDTEQTTTPDEHRKCPFCLYSLHGLPDKHHCPECGQEYDEHSRVWIAPRRWNRMMLLVTVGTQLIAVSTLLIVLPVALSPHAWVRWPIAIFYLLFIAFLFKVSRHSNYVAVTPQGVICKPTWLRAKRIPWAKVERFRFKAGTRWTGASLFYQSAIGTLAANVRHVLPTEANKVQFAKAIEEGKCRYV